MPQIPLEEVAEQLENPAEENAEALRMKEREDSLFEYQTASTRIKKIIRQWTNEGVETERRRKVREIRVSREDLILRGALKPDETIIPIRLCDTNIKREMPPYIAYLKQARRLAIFRCLDEPLGVTQPNQVSEIEKAFTEGMTYDSWEVPMFKCTDGALTHGWDAVEVELDYSRPLGVGIRHVGHENLVFPLEARDIQSCEQILVKYELNSMQLLSFVRDYGFNDDTVTELIDKKAVNDEEKLVKCYKRYWKWQGIVYYCWFGEECSGWLKDPAKLYAGVNQLQTVMVPTQVPGLDPMTGIPMMQTIQQPQQQWTPVDETQYPLEILCYSETEQPQIRDHRGRVYADEYKQEASTATATNFINALNRASGIYGSPKNAMNGAAPKQTDTVIEHGRIYNEPIDFWHPDYPDPTMLKALQWLDVQNASETNQPAWAVTNREDSRKTATEIGAAQEQTQLINSVSVTLYSTFIRRVYSRVWRIVQSLALQNKIKFMPIPGQPTVGPDGIAKSTYVNNTEIISKRYELRAAGDIDVVQRQEKLTRLMQFYSMVQGTALALPILEDMTRLAFPEDAEKYLSILNQALQLQAQQQAQQSPQPAQQPSAGGGQQQ